MSRTIAWTGSLVTLVCIGAAALHAGGPLPAVATPVQTGPGKPGSAKGFVRINGTPVTLTHAYGVIAPDSFDDSREVRLVLVTPTPIAADALAKAGSRRDVFALVPRGAIVEIRDAGHDVFLFHPALGDQRLQTGGGSTFVPATADRVSGSVETFLSGDEEKFGYTVRYEIAFDAPILKRLPLGKADTRRSSPARPVAAAPPPGPLPRTKADAEKWLAAQGLGTRHEGLAFYFALGSGPISADVVRAYLLVGAAVDKPLEATGDHPLSAVAIACDGRPGADAAAEVLLQAGANVNQPELSGRKATPAMAAVMCPALLKVILAQKPDLNAVDATGLTAMHYALMFGKPREDVARMIRDAGFDMKRWRASLLERGGDAALIDGLSGAAPLRPTRTAPATGSTMAPESAPPRAAIDWKALGPYPARTPAEAQRLLARPGAATSIDDHFWDGITSREPQRLAVALQAGASVNLLRAASELTPLMLLADRCHADRDQEVQLSIAEQLIAAGADARAVHKDGWTALMLAADDCPIGVVRALIKAGSPLGTVDKNGNTALKSAILDGRADVVEALIDAGLDPRKEPYNPGRLASGNKAVQAALQKRRR